jgi:hypothetical protein
MADARRQSAAGCWPAEEHDSEDAAAETTGGALSGDSSYQALETSTLVRALAHVVAGGGEGYQLPWAGAQGNSPPTAIMATHGGTGTGHGHGYSPAAPTRPGHYFFEAGY